ncbi:hypothetical protein S40285_05734 [Stachybotrys chlorohalonatus IBT 40285]|uniref:C3H1-type domain-containing protein n=1 Tax=Stachybotrys chlorohalonatus (strain IBT 40285) TaxID=1283841 RepID=A0A084QSK5_STAC4|nr:hypothetical protein S40285_05734 [Stachybotrys chlorohalonata IBT 40285]
MTGAQTELDALKADWELCKVQDDQKHSLISGLLACIEDLSDKLSEVKSELRDKKDVVKLARKEAEEAEKQIQALKLEKARHAFASVIIDGDCMPFKDELVTQGLDGGKRAAHLLKLAVNEELQSWIPATAPHLRVVIRVYANVKGLAKTYKEMEVLSEPVFNEFIRGFNMGNASCDYIDAGDGKECSDKKVEATVQLHLPDTHCQQILFGGTADNGYARLLGPYAEDEEIRGRITLLEGPPFAYELADIKDKFHTASFKNVFRSGKLLNSKRRVSFLANPSAIPSGGYASAVAKSLISKPPSATQQGSTTSRAVIPTQLLRNNLGQRVDAPLTYLQKDFIILKNRKLCNHFHLLGKCPFLETNGKCQHYHGERVSISQAAALRAVARQSPCQRRLNCSDPDCIFGHRCTRDNCVPGDCKFHSTMHHTNTEIVS